MHNALVIIMLAARYAIRFSGITWCVCCEVQTLRWLEGTSEFLIFRFLSFRDAKLIICDSFLLFLHVLQIFRFLDPCPRLYDKVCLDPCLRWIAIFSRHPITKNFPFATLSPFKKPIKRYIFTSNTSLAVEKLLELFTKTL